MYDTKYTSNLINPVTGQPYTQAEIEQAISATGGDANRYSALGDMWGYSSDKIEYLNNVINDYWTNQYNSQLKEQQASGETQGEADEDKKAQFEAPLTSEDADYNANQQAVDVQQAIADSAQTAQQESENNAIAAASAGVNKSRAGMLSDNASQSTQTSNVSNIASANSSQAASTQADYLQKMKQADALDNQAKNMQKGAALTAIGSGLQGAAAGASAGAMISDEDMKEPVDFDADLYEAIRQFKELYHKVKELRRNK